MQGNLVAMIHGRCHFVNPGTVKVVILWKETKSVLQTHKYMTAHVRC
jgi:hypothetical protein